MEGYHSIERMLADHFQSTQNQYIKFPPVAGFAGCTHLYKVGTDHTNEPWNWTGWIPRWRHHIALDSRNPGGRRLCNRFFMAFRGNEIQNDLWDYHPVNDEEMREDLTEDDFDEDQIRGFKELDTNDRYRGGYWFEGNSWARYLHINTIKSHERDEATSCYKRYNYIVHPLSYRTTTNQQPDNSVDGIQWAILNIVKEPHFGNLDEWGEKCHGLEIFNDFSYYGSYNPEYSYSPVEEPKFTIPCHNGDPMNRHKKSPEDAEIYVWWFDTYPLEYAEFLLDTALSRGVYLHPLASNDATYNRQTPLAELQDQLLNNPDEQLDRDSYQQDAVRADPKGAIMKRVSKQDLEFLRDLEEIGAEDEYIRRGGEKKEGEDWKEKIKFLDGLPYKDDTAFGYTTLIDPKCEIKQTVEGIAGPDKILGTADDRGTLDDASNLAFDYLIDGRHFAHLGVYGLFNYHALDEKFPIVIEGQEDKTKPCYQMTEDMELIFTFMPCKKEHASSFTHTPNEFIWKYSVQFVVDENEEETIHGYFNLDDERKTRLNLTNYDKTKMKWIRFTCIEPESPQQRAWFLPIKGLAFGEPRNLIEREDGVDHYEDQAPKMRHHIAIIEETEEIDEEEEVDEEDQVDGSENTLMVSVRCLKQADAYFDKVLAVESKDLKFYFDKCTDEEEQNIYAYFLQVCPNQQDLEILRGEIPNIDEINDPVLPPRIMQSVHGFLELNNRYPTRLDLSNQWDKNTVLPSSINVEGEEMEIGPVVFFYAIDSKSFNPIEINPRPGPISAEYDLETKSSTVTKLEHEDPWIGIA